MQTNHLVSPELNILYSSEGEMTPTDLTKLGTSSIGTVISSLVAGNLPNAKKNLSNVSKISLLSTSLFESILEYKFNLRSSCIFLIRRSGSILK